MVAKDRVDKQRLEEDLGYSYIYEYKGKVATDLEGDDLGGKINKVKRTRWDHPKIFLFFCKSFAKSIFSPSSLLLFVFSFLPLSQ